MSAARSIPRRVRGQGGGVPLNTAVSALRTLVRLGAGFLLLPILLHRIGPARTGLFLFATTLTGYFTAIEVGVSSSVTRFVAEHRVTGSQDDLALTLRGSLAVMVAVGLVAGLVLVTLALVLSGSLFRETQLRGVAEPTILVAAGTSLLYWPSRVGVAALSGVERYDQAAAIQIVSTLVLLPALAILASAHTSVPVLAAVFGALTVSEGLVAGLLAWRPLGATRAWLKGVWLRGAGLRPVLRFGAAAAVIGVADTLVNSFDRTIITATVGAGAIVGYDLALRPTTAVRTIAGISGLALISPVARLAAQGRTDRVRQLVNTASYVSVLVSAPVAVLVIVLARPFVGAWLGPGYVHDSTYVQIFVSLWLLNCVTTALTSGLYGIGRLGGYARIVIVAAVASLALSVVLALAWGTVGVIWGTVIPGVLVIPLFTRLALGELSITASAFMRDVVLPSFGMVLAWSVPVVAVSLLVSPHGYAGLILFSVAALVLFWVAAGPRLAVRWRAVRAG